MSMNISDDDLLRFHYSSTSTIEANIYFFVLDSTSREKLNITKASTSWPQILLPAGQNLPFCSSSSTLKTSNMIQDLRIPLSQLPSFIHRGRVHANIYDIVMIVRIPQPAETPPNEYAAQQEAYFFRLPYCSRLDGGQEQWPVDISLPLPPRNRNHLLSSPSLTLVAAEGDNDAKPTFLTAKLISHRIQLRSGVFESLGSTFCSGDADTNQIKDEEVEGVAAPSIQQSLNSVSVVDNSDHGIEMPSKGLPADDPQQGDRLGANSSHHYRSIPFQNAEEQVRKDSECVICLAGSCQIVSYPCRHSCLCLACATEMTARGGEVKCPICRIVVILFLHIL